MLKALKVFRVFKELQAHKAQLERQVPKVQQETMEQMVMMEPRVLLAHKELRVPLVLLVVMVLLRQ